MNVSDSGINQDAFDRYTSAHFGVGVVSAIIGAPWWLSLISSVGWEMAENGLKTAMPGAFPYASHDSLANAATDTLAWMAGWGMGRLAMQQTDVRDRAALEATVGATVGAVALPIASLSSNLLGIPATTQRARVAYGVGSAMGAALADFMVIRRRAPQAPLAHRLAQSALTGLGGALAGPAGAGVAAYLATAAREKAA